MNNKKIVWGLLLAILIAAFALRVTDIKNIPSGIYPDEAQNGVDALDANATGQYKLFYETNNGREGLFINLQALSIKTFGPTEFALKLWSIIFGTLTVLGVFLLAKELFGDYTAGLIGAYLTAFSYWAINFSRIGFRAIMVPFILSFAFYFIFKGLRTKKLHDFIIAGLIYGLGVHTYIAFRVSPLVLVALIISLIITRKNFIKEYWKHVFVFAFAMFVTAAPMLADFFYFHPEHYASRTSEISVLNPVSNQGHLLTTVAKTFGLALQKYFVMGDLNMRHNYAPYPLLNPIVAVAFLVGLIYCISKFFHLAWARFKKNERDEKLDVHVLLLSWFFALLIPEFLANEGNPHALRSIGTLPAVILISIIPFLWVFKKYDRFGHAYKTITATLLIGAFIFIGLADPIKYFVFFANSPKQHEVFDANLRNVSDFIRTLPQNENKYIVTGSMERLTIKYLNPTLPNTSYYYPGEIDNVTPANDDKFVAVFTGWDWDAINSLRTRFPNLSFEEHRDKFGDTFITLSN
ncbi:MAG: glycosyltransferase family 39 protein [Candidatus Moranbacteria bacterium]|nr:glycosyltransferase family 39 protein [Candidatus Moranbacteria bacterium]